MITVYIIVLLLLATQPAGPTLAPGEGITSSSDKSKDGGGAKKLKIFDVFSDNSFATANIQIIKLNELM